jgi:hypothetical protein
VKLPTVVILMVGGVLVYSAVKSKSPLEVLKMGLQGKAAPVKPAAAAPNAASYPIPTTAPGQTITSV